MTQIGLIILIIISYEVINYFNFKNLIKFNLIIYKKFYSLLLNKKLSDSNKEKLIIKYSKKLFIISINIVFVLLIILISFFVMDVLIKNLINFSLSIYGILLSVFTIIIYIQIRNLICKITI